MFKFLIILLLFFVAFESEAKARYFVPVVNVPSDTQKFEYRDGVPLLLHSDENLSLTSIFMPESSNQAWLSISVRNNKNEPFVISEASFKAISLNNSLKIYSYDELVRDLKKKQNWLTLATQLGAAANSYSAGLAGYSNSSGTFEVDTESRITSGGATSYGSSKSYGKYKERSYDADAAARSLAEANRKNQELLDRSARYALTSQVTLSEKALKANTVSSGEVVSGQIRIDLPDKGTKEKPVEFLVTFNYGNGLVFLRYREFYF